MAAAEIGVQIWQQKGADAYLAYHNVGYATGHNEGKLTLQDIIRASAKAGKLKGKKAEALDTLSQIDALAQNLGLRGTPGLIVMPVAGATADNVTVEPVRRRYRLQSIKHSGSNPAKFIFSGLISARLLD
jgi:hypothetical protein